MAGIGMGELMSFVNSDLNVPLDERMKYVGGVIPRGIAQKTISKSTTTSFTGTVLDITGKGILIGVSTSGNHGACKAVVTITIDNKKTIVVSGGGASTTSLSTDIQLGASTIDLSESNITISVGSAAKTNDLIIFEESLKVEFDMSAPTTSLSSSASVSYGLF